MIDDAASMGLEMFVLDDGWYGNEYLAASRLPTPDIGNWQVNARKKCEDMAHFLPPPTQKN